MIANGRLVGIVVLLASLLAIPAWADSINAYNFSTNLVGANGTVSGSFTFDSTTQTFLNASISFASSMFGNPTLTDANSQGFLLVTGGISLGDSILYSILLNPLNLNQYWVNGAIGNSQGIATFSYQGNGSVSSVAVPEGGTFSILVLSGLVMFAGMLLASSQSQRKHET